MMPEGNAINPAHYSRFVIEPIIFIRKNSLSYIQGNVIKYICRYKFKNGMEDLIKARQYIDFAIQELQEEQREKHDKSA